MQIDTETTSPVPGRSVLTLDEVAADLRVSIDTVRRHVRMGKIPAFTVGRSWRVDGPTYAEWKARPAVPVVVDPYGIEPRSPLAEARRRRRR